MGTTVASIIFLDNKISICNLGDSRIYGFKNGELKQLSSDHTTAELNKKLGLNTPVKLTQYLGIDEKELKLIPTIKDLDYSNFEKILLCTDGLTNMLTDEEISNIIAENNNTSKIVDKLINESLKKGGNDNITVMLFKIKEDIRF